MGITRAIAISTLFVLWLTTWGCTGSAEDQPKSPPEAAHIPVRAKALPRTVANAVPEGGYPDWKFPDQVVTREPTPCRVGQPNAITLAPRGHETKTVSLADLFEGPFAHPIEGGRHAREPAVAVAALLGNVDEQHEVLIWSCDGERLTLPPYTLTRAPGRWVLVQSSHGMLKLLDREAPDGDRRPVLRAPTVWEWTPAGSQEPSERE